MSLYQLCWHFDNCVDIFVITLTSVNITTVTLKNVTLTSVIKTGVIKTSVIKTSVIWINMTLKMPVWEVSLN